MNYLYEDPARQQAFEDGEDSYYRKRPCEICDGSRRYVDNDECAYCRAERQEKAAERRREADQEARQQWRHSWGGRLVRLGFFMVFTSDLPGEKHAAKQQELAKTVAALPYGVRVLVKLSGVVVIVVASLLQLGGIIAGAWLGVTLAEGDVILAIVYGALGLPVGFIAANWLLLFTLQPLRWLMWQACRFLGYLFKDEVAEGRDAEQRRMQDELTRIRKELARLSPRP